MSFGKSKQKTSSQQSGTSTTTVDPWSKQQYENQTKGILDATLGYTQSGKPTVAGMNPTMMKARDLAAGSTGNWQGILGEAGDAARAGLNYDAADPSRYYNRFEEDVINSTSAMYDEDLARKRNQMNDSVAQRGAFGNVSRDLGDAELMRGAAMDKANAIAQLKYQGYNDAVDTGFRDAANKYTGSGILGSLGGQMQQLAQSDVAMLEQLGATERDIENAMMKGELDKLLLELQARQGILGATPFGTSTTSSGTASGTGKSSNMGLSFGFGPKGFSLGG